MPQRAVALTGRARVNRIERQAIPARPVPDAIDKLQRVRLDELVAAVARLRLDVHAYDVETRLLVALRGTTGPAKQIEQHRLHHEFAASNSRAAASPSRVSC